MTRTIIDHRGVESLEFDLSGFHAISDHIRKHLPNREGNVEQQQLSFMPPLPAMRRIETPAARNTDPETSHEAAAHITDSGARAFQQGQTVAAVRAYPGRTMQELAELTGLDRYMLGRRVSECETAGLVVRGAKRQCSVTGRSAEPWWPVDDRQARAA